MLSELVTIVLMFKYPPRGASIFPARRMVDAVRDDVCIWLVETAFENVALLAVTLEIVRDPAAFVIAVVPSCKVVRVGA